TLYFKANRTKNNGNIYEAELYKYDGATVSLAADINPGTEHSGNPNSLITYNNELYFTADNGVNGSELMALNGENPVVVADIVTYGSSSPNYFASLNNQLYFVADDGITGRELTTYDGSAISIVEDLNADANLSIYSGT